MRAAITTAPALVAAGVLLCSAPVFARAGGQPGATGSPGAGQCNRCHGGDEYRGAHIELPREYLRQCVVDELGEGGNPTGAKILSTFWSVPADIEIPISFVVPEAPVGVQGTTAEEAEEQMLAPDELDPGTPGLYCPRGETCGTTNAGFGLEVQGGGNGDPATGNYVIYSGSSESGVKQAPTAEVIPGVTQSSTEVIHNAPRTFTDGQARWDLILDTSYVTTGVIQVYASANVCNGNGAADGGDITSRMADTIYIQDGNGNTQAPCDVVGPCGKGQYVDEFGECACPEGFSLTSFDDSGNPTEPYCTGQGLCAQSETPKSAAWPTAMFLVLGGFLLRRRRR